MTDAKLRSPPSALPPTEAELAAWNALTREEQISRYREYLNHPDSQRVSSASMADVLKEARELADRRRG